MSQNTCDQCGCDELESQELAGHFACTNCGATVVISSALTQRMLYDTTETADKGHRAEVLVAGETERDIGTVFLSKRQLTEDLNALKPKTHRRFRISECYTCIFKKFVEAVCSEPGFTPYAEEFTLAARRIWFKWLAASGELGPKAWIKTAVTDAESKLFLSQHTNLKQAPKEAHALILNEFLDKSTLAGMHGTARFEEIADRQHFAFFPGWSLSRDPSEGSKVKQLSLLFPSLGETYSTTADNDSRPKQTISSSLKRANPPNKDREDDDESTESVDEDMLAADMKRTSCTSYLYKDGLFNPKNIPILKYFGIPSRMHEDAMKCSNIYPSLLSCLLIASLELAKSRAHLALGVLQILDLCKQKRLLYSQGLALLPADIFHIYDTDLIKDVRQQTLPTAQELTNMTRLVAQCINYDACPPRLLVWEVNQVLRRLELPDEVGVVCHAFLRKAAAWRKQPCAAFADYLTLDIYAVAVVFVALRFIFKFDGVFEAKYESVVDALEENEELAGSFCRALNLSPGDVKFFRPLAWLRNMKVKFLGSRDITTHSYLRHFVARRQVPGAAEVIRVASKHLHGASKVASAKHNAERVYRMQSFHKALTDLLDEAFPDSCCDPADEVDPQTLARFQTAWSTVGRRKPPFQDKGVVFNAHEWTDPGNSATLGSTLTPLTAMTEGAVRGLLRPHAAADYAEVERAWLWLLVERNRAPGASQPAKRATCKKPVNRDPTILAPFGLDEEARLVNALNGRAKASVAPEDDLGGGGGDGLALRQQADCAPVALNGLVELFLAICHRPQASDFWRACADCQAVFGLSPVPPHHSSNFPRFDLRPYRTS